MKTKRFFGMLGLAIAGSALTLFIYAKFIQPDTRVVEVPVGGHVKYASLPAGEPPQAVDFTFAAEKSVNAVVHVKTTTMRENMNNPFYEFFFGDRQGMEQTPVMGFGSGVIVTENGYIITNNHVIDGSDDIEVVLNDRRSYKAKLVGSDPSTDIALLKIDETGLPFLTYGDSDKLKLGEWVLAIGNPYNLTSTVTAGIVSAKARNINILRGDFSIESFIQTDAAVNPGNSGGALVNTNGELVGINTAIASRTGDYTGYSFAIPVSIVHKVVSDLIEFGDVQRAILGVTIQDLTSELAGDLKIGTMDGVYINGIRDDGAAKEAGIKAGDVVTAINGVKVNSVAQLQEQVSKYRPKDKITVDISRDGKVKQFDVVLRNTDGNTEIVRATDTIEALGASFEPASDRDKRALGIHNGVKVTGVKSGKFMKVGIKEGFIITSINNQPVNSVNDIKEIINKVEGGVYIEGVYGDGSRSYYAFGM